MEMHHLPTIGEDDIKTVQNWTKQKIPKEIPLKNWLNRSMVLLKVSGLELYK